MIDPTRSFPTPDGGTASFAGSANDVTLSAPVSIPPEPATGVASPPGYDLLEEVGRGGMGVVYRARDRGMNREVAVKVLADRYAPNSLTARRFLDEAQITGQLSHPGIPAVHQVGTLPDGRPFLAMKLIKGQTLDVLLASRERERPEFGRWLGVFEAICQAVGYAHSKGVIHRDLKPQNVMVGAFGEVQVMDWGLAKVLAASRERERPESEITPVAHAPGSPSEIRTPRESDHHLTQAGSVMGTPAYMSPEQAAGEIDRIDKRSDVFGLGAVLCTLLSGSPPYSGTTAEAVRLLAVRGQTAEAFARLDASGAEPELVALCKQCLAFAPTDRPANAGELATVVADFRRTSEERARQAEVDRAKSEVATTEWRKRRRVLLVLAVSVMSALLLWWWRETDRKERQRETARTVDYALARAEEIGKQLPPGQSVELASAEADLATAKQAVAAVEQAEAALLAGISDHQLSERVRQAKEKLLERVELADKRVVVARLEAVFLNKLPEVRSTPELELAEAGKKKSDLYRDLFHGLGIDIANGDLDRVCDQIFHLHLARDQAQVALYDWRMNHAQYVDDDPSRNQLRNQLSAILDRMDQDRWRVRFRKVIRAMDQKAFDEMLQEADDTRLPADSYLLLYWAYQNLLSPYWGGTEEASNAIQIRLLERAQLLYPDNPIVHEELGDLHHWGARAPTAANKLAAISCYRAALSLRPNSDGVRTKLFDALVAFAPAEAIAWAKLNLKNEPTRALWHERLALALNAGGHRAAALVNYRRAVDLEPTVPHYARLSWALVNDRKGDEAIAVARECHARLKTENSRVLLARMLMVQRRHESDEYLAITQESLRQASTEAERYSAAGQLVQAHQFRKEDAQAVRVWEQFVEKHPKHWQARRDLAGYLEKTKDAKAVAEAYRAILTVMPDEPASYLTLADNVFTDPFTLTPYRHFILNEGLKAHPKWLTEVPGYRLKLAAYACEAAATTHRHAPQADEKRELWRSALGWMSDEWKVQLAAADKHEKWAQVRRTVGEWLDDPNPAGVRRLTTSNKLPESERQNWNEFWANVRELYDIVAPLRETLPRPRRVQ